LWIDSDIKPRGAIAPKPFTLTVVPDSIQTALPVTIAPLAGDDAWAYTNSGGTSLQFWRWAVEGDIHEIWLIVNDQRLVFGAAAAVVRLRLTAERWQLLSVGWLEQ